MEIGKIRYNNLVSDELGKREGLVQWRQHLPGFDFPIRHHMWTEFVGSLLCS